jgi:hypothetical protein
VIGALTFATTIRAALVPVLLVVCGDPEVARVLALVLRGFSYDARFLSLCPLGESGSLDDVRLLLVGPTLRMSAGHREALLTSLRHEAGAASVTSRRGGYVGARPLILRRRSVSRVGSMVVPWLVAPRSSTSP